MDLTSVLVNATIARCRASTARNVTLLLVICTDLAILISNLSSVPVLVCYFIVMKARTLFIVSFCDLIYEKVETI